MRMEALYQQKRAQDAKPSYQDLLRRVRRLEAENRRLKAWETEQKDLERRLADALAKILSGFLPICARCKRIREETGRWSPIETYIQDHTEAVFSHSLCPDCARDHYPDFVTTTK
ncbi:MAG: hypothetical protein JRI97_03180 [Deltaproteobacteria bacterium]|nr:hypothetical protein [Deltaproteobacteria bacterium]